VAIPEIVTPKAETQSALPYTIHCIPVEAQPEVLWLAVNAVPIGRLVSKLTLASLVGCIVVYFNGCGGNGNYTLQSIRINQKVAAASSQFTATGIYSDGTQTTPLAVGWFQWTFSSFLVGTPHYSLRNSPFLPQCASGTALTIMAVAPLDPHAQSSGTIPVGVFQDFALGKTNTEGGFVAGTIQQNCP
jgi:hypothetical protein